MNILFLNFKQKIFLETLQNCLSKLFIKTPNTSVSSYNCSSYIEVQ